MDKVLPIEFRGADVDMLSVGDPVKRLYGFLYTSDSGTQLAVTGDGNRLLKGNPMFLKEWYDEKFGEKIRAGNRFLRNLRYIQDMGSGIERLKMLKRLEYENSDIITLPRIYFSTDSRMLMDYLDYPTLPEALINSMFSDTSTEKLKKVYDMQKKEGLPDYAILCKKEGREIEFILTDF